jgi:hypothetical protein
MAIFRNFNLFKTSSWFEGVRRPSLVQTGLYVLQMFAQILCNKNQALEIFCPKPKVIYA